MRSCQKKHQKTNNYNRFNLTKQLYKYCVTFKQENKKVCYQASFSFLEQDCEQLRLWLRYSERAKLKDCKNLS